MSSVWRPYSGGTSGTSVSSIAYTGYPVDGGCRAYVGLRERLEGGSRAVEEEAIDAVSSAKLDSCRLFTSIGK